MDLKQALVNMTGGDKSWVTEVIVKGPMPAARPGQVLPHTPRTHTRCSTDFRHPVDPRTHTRGRSCCCQPGRRPRQQGQGAGAGARRGVPASREPAGQMNMRWWLSANVSAVVRPVWGNKYRRFSADFPPL